MRLCVNLVSYPPCFFPEERTKQVGPTEFAKRKSEKSEILTLWYVFAYVLVKG